VDNFGGRTDEEILSTLVHEMAHLSQEAHGKAPRRCYHDKQWGARNEGSRAASEYNGGRWAAKRRVRTASITSQPAARTLWRALNFSKAIPAALAESESERCRGRNEGGKAGEQDNVSGL